MCHRTQYIVCGMCVVIYRLSIKLLLYKESELIHINPEILIDKGHFYIMSMYNTL